jgi:hypothetical protein
MEKKMNMVVDDFGPVIPMDIEENTVQDINFRIKELHKIINCSAFGPPASEIMRAHRLLDSIVEDLKKDV